MGKFTKSIVLYTMILLSCCFATIENIKADDYKDFFCDYCGEPCILGVPFWDDPFYFGDHYYNDWHHPFPGCLCPFHHFMHRDVFGYDGCSIDVGTNGVVDDCIPLPIEPFPSPWTEIQEFEV